MQNLHITQAGNLDREWLHVAAKTGELSKPWTIPKNARPGDAAVIFTQGLGFVATATVMDEPVKRTDWVNRYGASLGEIKLIDPPISIAYIRSKIPDLTWAIYPRSITTPTESVSDQIVCLVSARRNEGVGDLDDVAVKQANLQELRTLAIQGAASSVQLISGERQFRIRSLAIRQYALARSEGYCEFCESEAPFYTPDGEPYLEVHHITQLSDDGPDHPENVIALCPNCHRRAHYSEDADVVADQVKKIVAGL